MRNKNIYFTLLKLGLIILFIILLIKFLLVTVYYNEDFKSLAVYQTDVVVDNPMPRGEIYDRNGNLLVGNKQSKDLIYLNDGNMSDSAEWKLAQKIADNINTDYKKDSLKEVDYKDFIIREDYDEIYSRLPDDEKAEMDSTKLEEDLRNVVNQNDINNLIDKYGEEAIYVRIKMDGSSPQSPALIASNLSTDEVYYIQSQLGNMGGCFIINSWVRTYPYDNTLRTFLGSVGDIPKQDMKKYQAMGYGNNDQVGTSYLEEELEPILKPISQEIEVYYDDNGNIKNYKDKTSGSPGDDVKLTIDIKLQKKVDDILTKELKTDNYPYFLTLFSSVIDPNTGDLYALGGIQDIDGKYYDDSIGNFTNSYEIGSIVKPAILLMGYESGTWHWDESLTDEPMDIGGGIVKASYHDYGYIDEDDAIKLSSNVYFYQVILAIAGIDYSSKDPLPQTIDQKYFDEVRSQFESFGLGAPTGIDIQNESTGEKSSETGVGLYMDLANGQYDTYTPLEVTQYISTLANGKNRMKINYLYSVNEPGEPGKVGPEKYRPTPEVLNTLSMDSKDIKHVQQAMLLPSSPGGTTNSAADPRYSFASKSGTSESYYYSDGMKNAVKTDNSTFMAYWPPDNPQYAVSVVMPYWTSDGDTVKTSATNIGAEVMDACYSLGYMSK